MKKDINLLNARWDLSPIYKSITDKNIKKDIESVEKFCENFPKKYKGKLNKNLEPALNDIILLDEVSSTLFAYFYLLSSRDAKNEEVKKITSLASEKLSVAFSKLAFFDIEVAKISDKDYKSQLEKSDVLKKHKPYLDKIRRLSKYQLTEEVETILTKISPFTSPEWDDMLDEIETKLEFKLGRKKHTLSEIIHIANTSHSSKIRYKAMIELNRVLQTSNYKSLRSRALNLVIGEKALIDKERGFKHPLEARNISNNLDDETVKALHEAVLKYGSREGKRYYNIIRKLLKKKTLLWSDRNAPLPFENKTYISWDKCKEIILNAYGDFSPTLQTLIEDTIQNNRIDAPTYDGKTSGAYNYTTITKGGKPYTWVFLNYMGNIRDVMTVAHELGHAVHGLLAGKKQGALQAQAPMAYAETASIFGEMLTFEYLMKNTKNKKERLALLLSKANDWLNSVNRQISFSYFEIKAHEKRKQGKLTTNDFDDIWLSVSKDMYGKDGEIFNYDNMENLWSYVSHFMRPFYVYAYSFGELFTQSLFAIKGKNKEKFEKLYLEMLQSGSTKDAVSLMKPFGLNPKDAKFWKQGIDISIKKWLDEAEKLIDEI